MGAVFISYRRGDSEGQARALSTELEDVLGENSVFMDVDSIGLGRDFRQVLQESLKACDLMLALIGPNWLDAKDPSGKRRLDNPGDFVRQEIAAALKRNIPVVPVLVQGAVMPAQEALPEDLQDLAYRNGIEISHTRWKSDVRELVSRLGLTPRTATTLVSTVLPPGAVQPDVSPVPAKPVEPPEVRTRPVAAAPSVVSGAHSAIPETPKAAIKVVRRVPVVLVAVAVPIVHIICVALLVDSWSSLRLIPALIYAVMFYFIFRLNTVKGLPPQMRSNSGVWSRDSFLAMGGAALMTLSLFITNSAGEGFLREPLGSSSAADAFIFIVFCAALLGGTLLVVFRHRSRTRMAREASREQLIST